MIAARIALPERASHVPLSDWATPEDYRAFMRPTAVEGAVAGKRFFNASPFEWRWALRRMARCGLIALIAPSALHPALSAGAFDVAKDALHDRLIGDRRPRNA